ncbi:MAG: AraC family transcriptional regulator [Eubacteriales bacterium]|nr:AraC family transcriptional regulator [Eubacteriales bacterium]
MEIPEEYPASAAYGDDRMNFRCSTTYAATGEYDLHCHNFYEIYLFLKGDADYLVEGRHYRPAPNSLLLLAPNAFHGVRINTDADYRRFALHFHPDVLSAERRALLLSVFPGAGQPNAQIYFENTQDWQLPAFFQALSDCSRLEPVLAAPLMSVAMEGLLARIYTMAAASCPLNGREPVSDPVSALLLYLNSHVREPVTLDQLSERFFISKHHLNKVFRRATGTTVFDYLLHKRVILAQQLLADGHSAQEAALQAGFGDYSSFYRAYRRILGHSPLQDRGALPALSREKGERMQWVGLKGV